MSFKHSASILTLLAVGALPSAAAHAQAVPNTTTSNDNILNLLSPFLALNGTSFGQATLTANLAQSIATNNNATAGLQALAVSDKNLLGGRSTTITLANGTTVAYGVAANLAGGLPAQAAVTPSPGATKGASPWRGAVPPVGSVTDVRATVGTVGACRSRGRPNGEQGDERGSGERTIADLLAGDLGTRERPAAAQVLSQVAQVHTSSRHLRHASGSRWGSARLGRHSTAFIR